MLSRTASNLYWSMRYLERAESTARLLEACFQPGAHLLGNSTQLYALPLYISHAYNDFTNQYSSSKINMNNVTTFLISGNTFASVKNCLEAARENARSERSKISSETFEAINQTWLEFQDWQHRPLHLFKEWLQQRVFLVQGSISVTMPETLSRLFLHMGTFIERSNQTIRVLEASSNLKEIDTQSDYYRLSILLKSVSSFEAYQETATDLPTEDGVLEFLLFNESIPRSVHYCIDQVQEILEGINSDNKRPSLRSCANLLAKLRYDTIDDVIAIGRDEYLNNLYNEVSNLAVIIQEGHFVTL